jgi:hypothetical protein
MVIITLAKCTLLIDNDFVEPDPANAGKHCIMVYLEDFSDKQQVLDMYNYLVKLNIIHDGDDIAFKPDALTSMQLENPLFRYSEINDIYEKDGSLNMGECDKRITYIIENRSNNN